MTLVALALAGGLTLGADPAPAAVPPAEPLPRSSIAAVLAHRGELGLTDAEARELERRDDAVAKRQEDLREQLSAARRGGGSRSGGTRSGPGERGALPLSPTASALPEGASGGGHRGGSGGSHRGEGRGAEGAQDPAVRAAALQSRMDDADTAAWLSAESVLDPSRREKARDVAERFRETLADRREAERKAHAGK